MNDDHNETHRENDEDDEEGEAPELRSAVQAPEALFDKIQIDRARVMGRRQ